METIADVLAAARAREREGVAFDVPDRSTGYSFREFATTAWKAGNLLRHYGVRTGSRVGVLVGPKQPGQGADAGILHGAPDPVLAGLGATLLGGVAAFDPGDTFDGVASDAGDASVGGAFDGDALVAPAAWLDRVETSPGCTRIAYGGPPDAPDVVHFEQATWSQNPVAPPEAEGVSPDDAALADADGGERTHGDLLDRARTVVDAHDLTPDDRVSVAGHVDPDVFATGVLAPLLAGATILGGPDADAGAALVVDEEGSVCPGSGSATD